jgi:hypothetical protein
MIASFDPLALPAGAALRNRRTHIHGTMNGKK